MTVAIAGMVTGGPATGPGWLVRLAALLCFGAAVALERGGALSSRIAQSSAVMRA